jgi:hypothetical protein
MEDASFHRADQCLRDILLFRCLPGQTDWILREEICDITVSDVLY